MAEGFGVNPGELEGSGRSAQEIAGRVPGETVKVVGSSDMASGGLKGWQVSGALRDCTGGWKALLDRLGADMDAYGGKLISMAQTYRAGDRDAAASVSRAGQAGSVGPVAPAKQGDPFGTKLLA
ncbi:hypothetical protein ACGFX4_38840 [Kitasatospora sp. NPDC048365]|uniref:hypothetical protein n=1 Tax=Kitasatospora sp. NPDC048365 TaxID=3364050 RepID=UPI0037145A34